MLTMLPVFIILTVISTRNFEVTGCEFCRMDRLGVHFFPYFSAQNDGENYQGIQDVYPLITKISSEFSFVTVTLGDGMHAVRENAFVKAVAMANAKHSNNSASKSLQTWVEFTEDITMFRNQNFLFTTQKVVEAANKIYRATVTSIIFYPDTLRIIEGKTREKLLLIRKFFPKNEFMLGLGFPTEICESQPFNSSEFNIFMEIQRNLDLVDFLNLRIIHKSNTSDIPVDVEVIKLIDNLKLCAKTLEGNHSAELKLSFTVGLSDTAGDAVINYDLFVRRWTSLTGLLSSENYTLIMLEAFDNPHLGLGNTFGWWRLRENRMYTSAAQFEFEDKKTIAERELKKTPEFLISQLEKDVYFNSKRTSIKFSPVLSIIDTSIIMNHDPDMIALQIETISTKFSSIMIHDEDYRITNNMNTTNIWVAEVLDAVAEHNARSHNPLDVTLGFQCRTLEDANSLIDRVVRGYIAKTYFIKNILINDLNMDCRTYLLQKLHSFDVKIGFMLDIEKCILLAEQASESPIMQAQLREVDFLYFSYLPLHTLTPSYGLGVDRVVPQVTSWLDVCKSRLKNYFPEKEIGLQTGYSDTFISVREDYTSFALFWNEIHIWADKTNATAFDTIHYRSKSGWYRNMGWWKFIEPLGMVKNYTFIKTEDKRSLAVKSLAKSLPSKPQSDDQKIIFPTKIVFFIVLTILGSSLLVILIVWKVRKANQHNEIEKKIAIELTHTDISSLPSSAFVRTSAQIIGIGNFGTVYKCFMSQFQAVVAVKTISSNKKLTNDYLMDGWKCLLSEVKIMCHIGKHENIVRLLGVCQEKFLYIVTEYCENGSLLSYVRSLCAKNITPQMYDLLQFCMDIANGMQFLEEKNVIHGDLSARNVLLDGSKTCKLCDFGLSRKIYQQQGYIKQGAEPLPWRWMAPESLSRKEFTPKSDVWSMGVTFWEVFTLGNVPFPDMSWDDTFYEKLANGMRLKQPQKCDNIAYQLLLSCWEIEENCRPTAKLVFQRLKELKSTEYDVL